MITLGIIPLASAVPEGGTNVIFDILLLTILSDWTLAFTMPSWALAIEPVATIAPAPEALPNTVDRDTKLIFPAAAASTVALPLGALNDITVRLPEAEAQADALPVMAVSVT